MVPQGDGQHDHPPGAFDGAVVAAASAGDAESVQQRPVGDGGEEVADGSEGGAIFQLAAGEEGVVGMDQPIRRLRCKKFRVAA